jgi:hypothetical protein
VAKEVAARAAAGGTERLVCADISGGKENVSGCQAGAVFAGKMLGPLLLGHAAHWQRQGSGGDAPLARRRRRQPKSTHLLLRRATPWNPKHDLPHCLKHLPLLTHIHADITCTLTPCLLPPLAPSPQLPIPAWNAVDDEAPPGEAEGFTYVTEYQYRDEEAQGLAQRGDNLFYPENEALHCGLQVGVAVGGSGGGVGRVSGGRVVGCGDNLLYPKKEDPPVRPAVGRGITGR